MGIQFNQEVTRAIGLTHIITIPINVLTIQTTMNDIHRDLMAWKEPIQKPRGNILTEEFSITVARMRNVRHCPQCKNQMKLETKMSLCVVVIYPTRFQRFNHFRYRLFITHWSGITNTLLNWRWIVEFD